MITEPMKLALAAVVAQFNTTPNVSTPLNTRDNAEAPTMTTISLENALDGSFADFTLSILKAVSGESKWAMLMAFVNGMAKLHFVLVPDDKGGWASHCILEYNGMFVDHNFQEWMTRDEMQVLGGYSFQFNYKMLSLTIKYVWAKFLTLKNKFFPPVTPTTK